MLREGYILGGVEEEDGIRHLLRQTNLICIEERLLKVRQETEQIISQHVVITTQEFLQQNKFSGCR